MAVVLNPDELSVSEALRIQEELDRIHIPLSALCLNKKGISTAHWNLDEKLSGHPIFEIDFIPSGIHGRNAVAAIDMTALITDFINHDTHRKGNL